ncbi:hypothetical protein COP2_033283 [Malus domestica]
MDIHKKVPICIFSLSHTTRSQGTSQLSNNGNNMLSICTERQWRNILRRSCGKKLKKEICLYFYILGYRNCHVT